MASKTLKLWPAANVSIDGDGGFVVCHYRFFLCVFVNLNVFCILSVVHCNQVRLLPVGMKLDLANARFFHECLAVPCNSTPK